MNFITSRTAGSMGLFAAGCVVGGSAAAFLGPIAWGTCIAACLGADVVWGLFVGWKAWKYSQPGIDECKRMYCSCMKAKEERCKDVDAWEVQFYHWCDEFEDK